MKPTAIHRSVWHKLTTGLTAGLLGLASLASTHAADLTASDGATGANLGRSVSQSGTIGLAGAAGAKIGSNSGQGAAYVFRNLDTASGTVTQDVKLTASDGAANDNFGWSVSQSGTIGLVGAFEANSLLGAAYVFRALDTASGTVTQNVKLTASDAAFRDQLGASVSQSGTIGLVGASGASGFQGAAYVFRNLDTASGTVTQNVKLTASDGAASAGLGGSVSLSGSIGLVGADNTKIGSNTNQGAAYVFRNLDTASGTVTQNVELTASDGAASDQFAWSVSQSGTIGLVGAIHAHIGSSNQGAAYVFRNLDSASGTVTQNVKLTASDGAVFDLFGWSVSQSGAIGLVGSINANIGSNGNQGAVYVFRNLDTASGTVTQDVKLTASDGAANDSFGNSVSLSGDQFTIGANAANSSIGKAYTGTVSSVTTLDAGSTSRTIDGISFVSQDDWIIGQTTSSNTVTLLSGNSGDVTASSKAVYVGQNAGSNNNTLIIAGSLTANQIDVGAVGNTGNILQLGNGGTTGTLSPGSVITDNGTVVFDRSNTITQGTDFGSAAITGGGSVKQIGTGTTVLNAANSYSGGTLVITGTLTVNNTSGSGTGTGALEDDSSAVIDGTGRIVLGTGKSVKIIGGTLAAGDQSVSAAGKLLISTVTASGVGLNFSSSGTLQFRLFSGVGGGDNSGNASAADELEITGNLNITGSNTFDLVNDSGSTSFSVGDRWKLLDWSTIGTGTISGAFTTFTLPSLGGGLTWDTSNLFVTTGALSGTIDVASAAPEPSRALLLIMGLGALGMRRRRR